MSFTTIDLQNTTLDPIKIMTPETSAAHCSVKYVL